MRLEMDRVTLAEFYKLAEVYQGWGLEEEDKDQHCPFCADSKQLM